MKEWEKVPDEKKQKGNRDHPEQYPTDEESLFDQFDSERNVDPLPMEDIAMELREEKKRDGEEKSDSSSERKLRP
ncbi:hypothetical protein L1N82_13890 [Paenibacillus tarimensis]|nr:hypothetical protein [Paenibacillus tarimensis]MCF2944703.1 hypothetical protein [Paenibacillus tarimensis]